MDDSFILTLITGLGVGGVVGGYFTELFRRQTRTQIAESEEKEARFRSVAIYMQVYLYPDQISHLPVDVLKTFNLKTREDIEQTLLAEYSRLALFAPDPVLREVKAFMENPSETNYWKALTEMRKALWGKKTSLSLGELMPSYDHHP